MTFAEAIKTCLRKYVTFSGRASRSEYWWFFLFCFLGGLIFGSLETFINGITGSQNGPTLLSSAFNIATFLPALAAGWRRMHDTGRSGLYLLYPMIVMIGVSTYIGLVIGFEPLATGDFDANLTGLSAFILMIGGLVLMISPFLVIWWLTRPSEPGENQYGPNPHGVLS